MLEFEQQYLAALPLSEMYERSYMHRDTLTAVAGGATWDVGVAGGAGGGSPSPAGESGGAAAHHLFPPGGKAFLSLYRHP